MRRLDVVRDLALDLIADCAQCAAVCCVATSFDASEDFAFDKPAGTACPYVRPDCRCAIHDQLAVRGMRGCAIYDCHGAGPRVTRAFAGRPGCERERNEAFLVLRVVHEQLWLLSEAAALCERLSSSPGELDRVEVSELAGEIDRALVALEAIAHRPALDLLAIDLGPRLEHARALLGRVGAALGGRRRAARLLAVSRRRA